MWKSTASWARGTEGNTSQTGGSQAYKKRLSFPPVHGFGEWSVKQYVPPVAPSQRGRSCLRFPAAHGRSLRARVALQGEPAAGIKVSSRLAPADRVPRPDSRGGGE